jgi:hypothetical protein
MNLTVCSARKILPMKIRTIILLIFIVGQAFGGHAQEVTHTLRANPQKQGTFPAPREKAQAASLQLPVWDDFSYKGPYPDPALWADNFVFVNQSFGHHSKTAGVATFDALDEHGRIYEHILPTNMPYPADHLSSHPIRLDSLLVPAARPLGPSDSVILSFYYQPQGNGGPPTADDALKVQFLKEPGHFELSEEGEVIWVDDLWETVWETKGMSLSKFSGDTFPYFKKVTIPVDDPVYFRKDFRFRFVNEATYKAYNQQSLDNITGGRAIWNIDYVYLNHGRSEAEDFYFDIAFASGAQPILRRYSTMPWSHYIVNAPQHLRESFSLKITNLDNTTYPYSYRYFIRDESGNVIRNYSGGTWNLSPFVTSGYQPYQPHANPIVIPNPLPTAPAESRYFDIVHVVRTGIAGDDRPRNDTIIHRQSFQDYFAYDDGIPEQGYGLIGRNPRLAYRFSASHTDELGAIRFFFNPSLNDQNEDRPFRITVWESLYPEEVILYQSEEIELSQYGDGLNRFVEYALEQAVIVSGTFYVGFVQTGNIGITGFLSIGFDWSRDASANLFFKTGSEWEQSIMTGALMIRPVMGAGKQPTTIREPGSGLPFTVYPNPVSGNSLNVHMEEGLVNDRLVRLEVFDLYGRLVYTGGYSPSLDLHGFSNGIYILRLTHPETRQSQTQRFMIAR